MKLLDRYFISELFKMLIISTFVAELVLLGMQGIRLTGLVVSQGLEIQYVVKMIWGLALSFLPLVFPISFLFSLLMVFGRMSTDREFLALQAMGSSPARLIMPSIFVGVLATLLSLWASFSWGPQGNQLFERMMESAYRKKVTAALRSGVFSEGFLNMLFFSDKVDPLTQELRRVFIYDEKNFQEQVSISAPTGRWIESGTEGLGVLRLYDGIMVTQNRSTDGVSRVRFDEYNLYIDMSYEQGRGKNSPASRGWSELWEDKAKRESRGRDGRSIWTEIARRFAVSLACLLFVPLCFALSIDNRRTAKSRAVGWGLVLLFGYWTLYFAIVTVFSGAKVEAFAKYEIYSWIFTWIPNFFLLLWGAWLFRKRMQISR